MSFNGNSAGVLVAIFLYTVISIVSYVLNYHFISNETAYQYLSGDMYEY